MKQSTKKKKLKITPTLAPIPRLTDTLWSALFRIRYLPIIQVLTPSACRSNCVELVNSLVSRIYTVSVLEKVFELFVHLILSTCWVTWFGSEALISSDGQGKLA